MLKTAEAQQGKVEEVEVLQAKDSAGWDALVDRSPHGTVFHYSWWLEATGNDFEILVCRDGQGELVAGIPLPRKKRAGLTLFHSPNLTPYLGPIFDLSKAKSTTERLSAMRHLGESLARAIKGYDSFRYLVGAQAPDLQGFLWAGFQAQLAYTFRLDVGISIDQVLKGMARAQRGSLEKAERNQTLFEAEDKIDILMELNKKTFARQALSLPYPESLPRRLWAAAQRRAHGNIYLSCDETGEPVAGLLVVHDARTSYQILAGTNPRLQSLGGTNLVEWEAIRTSIVAGRAFDFEGSALRGVERYYRRWGGVAKPVFVLEKTGTFRGTLARLLLQLRDKKAN